MANLLPDIRGKIRQNVELSNTTWFRVGGQAKYLVKPEATEDLSYFLQNVSKDIVVLPLGVGSNVIVRDQGIDGVIVKLGRNFTKIDIDSNEVTIGAGALDFNTAHFLAQYGLSGLEFYVGIPGSIGGAVAMNAGAYESETSDFFLGCTAVRISDGKIFNLTSKDLGFVYRGNSLSEDFIFTAAKYRLYNEQPEKVLKKMNKISADRESTQPVRTKTGGSTFKNPPGHKAWKLIDIAGLRGFKIGGAQVSEKHCNFIINTGNATAADIENLGEYIIKTVYQNTGIQLQWEIKRIGNK